MESLWETNGKSMGSSCWLSLEYWLDQGQSIWFLTHWVNWSGHSMVYFLCIFLCLLSLYALFVTVISVCFLASFFQAVWSIPYLNSPLPIMKVSVLLEWIMEDHHRDNFSSGDGSYMQEAISVDVLCSHTVGISVLKGSLLLLIRLRTNKRLRSLSAGFFPLFIWGSSFSRSKVMDKNGLIICFYRAVGVLRGFRDFGFSSNKCEICILLSDFNKKSLDKNINMLISRLCLIYVQIKSLVWDESAYSWFMFWFAFWSSSSQSFQYPFLTFFGWNWSGRCVPGAASDENCQSDQARIIPKFKK